MVPFQIVPQSTTIWAAKIAGIRQNQLATHQRRLGSSAGQKGIESDVFKSLAHTYSIPQIQAKSNLSEVLAIEARLSKLRYIYFP